MNVLMMTNTYFPSVCGVSRSVASVSGALRKRGHRVLIVAPTPEVEIDDEPDVVRVPAVHHVTANDIPVRLPLPGYLWTTIRDFQPHLVHTHHPFLLGSTALRIAATWRLPVVFTYHTMYEHYTHNLPVDSAALERFTVRLATEFANQCDRLVAPSQSVRDILRARGVHSQISVVPTGIDQRAIARQRSASPPPARHSARGVRRGTCRPAFDREKPGVPHARGGPLLAAADFVAFLRRRRRSLRDSLAALCTQMGVADRLHMSDGALRGTRPG